MIDYLMLFKVVGLLLATFSSIVALFGDTTTRGKLNKKGYALLTLIILGTVSSVTIEIYQNKLEDRQRILNTEWTLTEKQSLFNFEISFAFRQEQTTLEFIESFKRFSVKYTYNEPNDIGRYKINTLKIIETDTNIILKDRFRLANLNVNQKLLGKNGAYFYPYFKDDLETTKIKRDKSIHDPTLIIGADKKDDSYFVIIGKSFTKDGWTYSSNRESDWTLPTATLCGFEANIPWKFVNTSLTLNSISDLTNIASFTVEIPNEINLNKVDELNFEFQTSDNQHLVCNIIEFKKSKTDNEHLISFSGFQLYNKLRELFNSSGGRMVPPIELH